MRVTRPISSISYNTKDFFINRLNYLLKLGYISYYEFITHKGDTDTKKLHHHLYCIPSKTLDLSTFKDFFNEDDPNNDKPLICEPFRVSNSFGDWYWYCLHDKDYLKSKNLVRNVFYSDSDIVSSCDDFHNTLVNENPLINFAKMSDMIIRDFVFECVSTGKSLQHCLTYGNIPLGKTQSVIALYNSLSNYYAPPKMRLIPNSNQVKEIKKNLFNDTIKRIKNEKIQPNVVDIDMFNDPLF